MPDLRNAILAIIAVLGLALAALPFAVGACAPSALLLEGSDTRLAGLPPAYYIAP